MKTLSKPAADVFLKLLALKQSPIDRSQGLFMPVHIEKIDRTSQYEMISLAHYGKQNGDLMADPEMVFALDRKNGTITPIYFQNDYAGCYRYGARLENETSLQLVDGREQATQTAFANEWLLNIAHQQEIR